MERCLSGHLYAMTRGDEECPVCVANKVKNDRIAELEHLLATAISIIKEIRPHDPQVLRSPYGLGTYWVDDEGAKAKRTLVDRFLAGDAL